MTNLVSPSQIERIVFAGRDESCGIRVDDDYASKIHARFVQLTDGSVFVEDCGSVNGTYVNEVQVYVPTPVRPGDVVRIGKTVLPWLTPSRPGA